MVPVCNINLRDLFKCLLKRINFRICINTPHSVYDAILRCKIIECGLFFYLCYHCFHCSVCPVGKKNRPCLRLTGSHMTNTVKFLVCTCIFMFFNHLVLIVIDTRTCYNTSLNTPIHRKFIDIVNWFILLNQSSFLYPVPEHVMCFLIYLICVCVNTAVKLCLCPVNIQKRERIIFHRRTCFFPIVNIVWKRCDLILQAFFWSVRAKWSDYCHVKCSS